MSRAGIKLKLGATEAELAHSDERSIRTALRSAETMANLIEDLSAYGRTIAPAAK